MIEKNVLFGKKDFQTESLKTPTRKMLSAFFVNDPVNSQQSTVNSQQYIILQKTVSII